MKPLTCCLIVLVATLLPACAVDQRDASAREWQRAECNRVIDADDRERCMKRIADSYPRR